jgi:hypothetical protein
MAEYELAPWPGSITRTIDHAFIPKDNDNIDYEAYLEWLAAGGVPDPAPPLPPPSG